MSACGETDSSRFPPIQCMNPARNLVRVTVVSTALLTAACGGEMRPVAPAPLPAGPVTTANVYILPGAVDLGQNAFGDEPVVIYKGERMRWRNLDGTAHNVVADSPVLPEFMTTGTLAPGEDRSFDMATIGTTKVHCTIHPQMVGTLVVRER